jgi:predicted nucleic acid-binding protein
MTTKSNWRAVQTSESEIMVDLIAAEIAQVTTRAQRDAYRDAEDGRADLGYFRSIVATRTGLSDSIVLRYWELACHCACCM